ncbi:MAG: hypothetical protein Q7V04_01400 [Deltaproteobacteria bacterium]|nr:hypothetical protein [Deltaproteobacteria bacterium]
MSEALTRNDFAGCLGSIFKVGPASAGQLELTLQQVSELTNCPGQESFSIILRGPAERLLQQGMYAFEHERIGLREIFIVPVARDEQGISYEAIFNRLVS